MALSSDDRNPQFSVVYTANGKLSAEMIKAFLETSGIPVLLNQESAGIALGLTVGPLGVVDILVPVEYETQARELLEEMEQGKFELDSSDEVDDFPEEE